MTLTEAVASVVLLLLLLLLLTMRSSPSPETWREAASWNKGNSWRKEVVVGAPAVLVRAEKAQKPGVERSKLSEVLGSSLGLEFWRLWMIIQSRQNFPGR